MRLAVPGGDIAYARGRGARRRSRTRPARPTAPPRPSRSRSARPRGGAAVPGTPARPTDGQRFDQLVLDIVADIEERWADRLGLLEYAVEDAPGIPDDWHPETVPLSSLVRGTRGRPTRLVVFRRPIEHRAESRSELEALVLTVVVEQVAELLGVDAELVDPRYRPLD